jgi:hypothetical protein
MTTTEYTFGDYNVSLAVEDNAPLGKLEDLHICHLGMKFTSPRQLPEFSVYEFEMSLKPTGGAEASKVKCCGVVVRSEPEGNGFRTIIHFAGVDESTVGCLESVTKAQKMRCDYCANC